MRILFDPGTPVPLCRHLPGHIVATTFEMGWSQLLNGDLLARAENQFDAFITTDKNLHHQQNLPRRTLAIVVLPFTSWPKLQKITTSISAAVDALRPGD